MLQLIRRGWFPLFLIVYVLYAAAFIYRTSTVVRGERYFLLLDDAMISMTYARNLAHGAGAVWFPGGEYVQGYSNPLWMLLMAAVHSAAALAGENGAAHPIGGPGVDRCGTLFCQANHRAACRWTNPARCSR